MAFFQNQPGARRNSPAVPQMAPQAGSAPPVEQSQRLKDMSEVLRINEVQRNAVGLHFATDEVLNIISYFTIPVAGGAAPSYYTLLTYTVSAGMLARIDHFACLANETFVIDYMAAVWRPEVNGNPVVNVIGPVAIFADLRNYHLCNVDPQEPTQWEPVWLQSGQTINIRLGLIPNFDLPVQFIGRIAGHIFKPTNPLRGI